MRKIVTGAVAFAFASALALPALAGGNCGYGHEQTAQTTPPVVAQSTVPVLTTTPPPADEPKG